MSFIAVGLDEICYHRVYETSNNAETFWSFVNDTLININSYIIKA